VFLTDCSVQYKVDHDCKLVMILKSYTMLLMYGQLHQDEEEEEEEVEVEVYKRVRRHSIAY
jgi:hypothetical protein